MVKPICDDGRVLLRSGILKRYVALGCIEFVVGTIMTPVDLLAGVEYWFCCVIVLVGGILV